MKLQTIKKSINVRWYLIKILIKSFLKLKEDNSFNNLDNFKSISSESNAIVVLCSGPSANKLEPKKKEYYIVTNDSYKIVKNLSFLYYVNDGYFFRRFLANSPLCKNHIKTLYFFRNEDKLHKKAFEYFKANLELLKNENYLISDFNTTINSANSNYFKLIDFLKSYKIPLKIQNSGIFMLLFGFYLAQNYNKELHIYGLDLGIGGNIHFEKGGHVGKSITSDRVKVNTKIQLDMIYKIMGSRVKNYSYFNSNL